MSQVEKEITDADKLGLYVTNQEIKNQRYIEAANKIPFPCEVVFKVVNGDISLIAKTAHLVPGPECISKPK